MKQFLSIIILMTFGLSLGAQTVTRDFATVQALRTNTKSPKKGEKVFVKANEAIYTYDHTDVLSTDDGVFTVNQGSNRWKCTSCKAKQIVRTTGQPTNQTTLDNNYLLYQNATTGSVYINNQSTPQPWQLAVSGNVTYITNINVLLHGGGENMDGTIMKTVYADQSYLPDNEPYTSLGYDRNNGGEEITGSKTNITDWVLVELRDKNNPKLVKYTKAGLLHKNGDIKDMDASTNLTFTNVAEDHYYIAVKHRNHLGIMSASPVQPTDNLSFSTGSLYWNPNNISDYMVFANGKYWLRAGKTNIAGLGTELGILGGYNEWELKSNEFAEGYELADYDLNRYVDISDYSIGIDGHILENGVWEELIPEFGKITTKLLLKELINPRSILLSRGNNADEPVQAPEGSFRYNRETGKMRVFVDGTGWVDMH